MSIRSHHLLLLLLCLNLPLCTAANPLPTEVSRLLGKYGLSRTDISLEVRRIGQAEPVLRLNADQPRNPGSVIKLVTTLAALELLGPAYTWKTRYYLDGTLRGDRLEGNLVMRGGADPYLVSEQFWRQLRALRERGLREIGGELVLDDSTLAVSGGDRGAFDDQPERVYNVLPSASLVNFSATRFMLVPRKDRLAIVADPPVANLEIDNRITLTGGECVHRSRGWVYQTLPHDEGVVVRFTGRYPAACGEYALTRAVLPNAQYTYGVFKALWSEMGGALGGGFRHGRAPGGQPFWSGISKPLREVITGINKFSNNVMARSLLLTIGLERYGEPGSSAAGVKAIRHWLDSRNVAMPALVMENGSGLSRRSRVTARGISNLLQAGWQSTYRPEFLASLPLSATDGTMRNRLPGEAAAGRVRIKTGHLRNSRAMAGYVISRRGNDYTVAMLMSGEKVDSAVGNQLQDALLRWVLER